MESGDTHRVDSVAVLPDGRRALRPLPMQHCVCGTSRRAPSCGASRGMQARSLRSRCCRMAAARCRPPTIQRCVCGTSRLTPSCGASTDMQARSLRSRCCRTAAARCDLLRCNAASVEHRDWRRVAALRGACRARSIRSQCWRMAAARCRLPTITTLRLWDIETGAELQRFEGHAGAVAVLPDGRRALSAFHDQKLSYGTSRPVPSCGTQGYASSCRGAGGWPPRAIGLLL